MSLEVEMKNRWLSPAEKFTAGDFPDRTETTLHCFYKAPANGTIGVSLADIEQGGNKSHNQGSYHAPLFYFYSQPYTFTARTLGDDRISSISSTGVAFATNRASPNCAKAQSGLFNRANL